MKKCLVCDKPLHICLGSDTPLVNERGCVNALGSGVICQTTGNYGSAVFDPCGDKGDEKIAFCVCDDCLMKKSDSIEYMVDGKITPIAEFKKACSGSYPQ